MFGKIFKGQGKPPHIEKVDPRELQLDPDLTPKHDPTWDTLAEGALKGEVPVYFASIPLSLCVPFDIDYRPDLHPAGAQAIEHMFNEAKAGRFQKMLVYPRGRWFVVSDDYIFYFAALRGMPDYVPCWVMGRPEGENVKDVQGPFDPESLRPIFGLQD